MSSLDPQADKASAAIDVGVESFSDAVEHVCTES